jgi:hypothetical protein
MCVSVPRLRRLILPRLLEHPKAVRGIMRSIGQAMSLGALCAALAAGGAAGNTLQKLTPGVPS